MKNNPLPNLVESAVELSQKDLVLAPELSTLLALDATLLATTAILEFQFPFLWKKNGSEISSPQDAEEEIIEAIVKQAKVLRENLSKYHACLRQRRDIYSNLEREVLF